MFKIITITFLCIALLIQPINNLLIVLSYVINKDFIATVLCLNREIPENSCEGRCQLTEQLKEQEKKKKEQEGTLSNKIDITLFLPAYFDNLFPPIGKKEYHIAYNKYIPSVPPFQVFHPPKVTKT